MCARVSCCGVVWYGSVVGGRIGWCLGVGVAKGNIFVGWLFSNGWSNGNVPKGNKVCLCAQMVSMCVQLWCCGIVISGVLCGMWVDGWAGWLLGSWVAGRGWVGWGFKCTMDFVDINLMLPS